jgi:hypothetical protein
MPTTNATALVTVAATGLPERGELLTRLHEKYGVRHGDVEGLDRSRLIHIVDTFDFLAQHLPIEGAVESARKALQQHMVAK